MGNSADKAPTADLISAVLVGGPTSLPEEWRAPKVSPLAEKIKVPHCGGYEHFERLLAIEMTALSDEIVFHWTMRTEVAE